MHHRLHLRLLYSGTRGLFLLANYLSWGQQHVKVHYCRQKFKPSTAECNYIIYLPPAKTKLSASTARPVLPCLASASQLFFTVAVGLPAPKATAARVGFATRNLVSCFLISTLRRGYRQAYCASPLAFLFVGQCLEYIVSNECSFIKTNRMR